jgi:hypothetical protein
VIHPLRRAASPMAERLGITENSRKLGRAASSAGPRITGAPQASNAPSSVQSITALPAAIMSTAKSAMRSPGMPSPKNAAMSAR